MVAIHYENIATECNIIKSICVVRARQRGRTIHSITATINPAVDSVEYAASPEKNEYYTYDKQGNILEKRIGNSIYKYIYTIPQTS